MAEKIVDLGQGFWNIRGDFRVAGVLNLGTQCALIQLAPGRFIFLDSYTLKGEVREQIMALTDQGKAVEAVLNVHPFHTLHCAQMARDFPHAIFYGSRRHAQKVPEVQWSPLTVESAEVAALYPQLRFSLPQGIYYIHPNEKIHVGSLLVHHPASQSLYVDDTFNTLPRQDLIRKVWKNVPGVMLNPLTRFALTEQADAGQMFCDWADQLAREWRDTRTVCAAHSDLVRFTSGAFEQTLHEAVRKHRPTLEQGSKTS